jgi:hypothetical protein
MLKKKYLIFYGARRYDCMGLPDGADRSLVISWRWKSNGLIPAGKNKKQK